MSSRKRLVYTPSALRRVAYGISGIIIVMAVGTEGFHLIEGMNYVNSVYFESMLATGQGPPLTLTTSAGKIFASVMAFVSVSSVITTLVFSLGPILATVWRETLEHAETEVKKIEEEIESKE